MEREAVPPLVLSFYYPWYGTPTGPGGKAHGGEFIHWEGVNADKRSIESSTHYPVTDAYDSYDPDVIWRHVQQAKQAGIDAFIVSWWGKGTFEDGVVRPILDGCAAGGVKACIYYEQVAKPGTPESVAAEFADILHRFGDNPAYLHVIRDGRARPVIFIYGRALRQLGLKKWKAAVQLIADADGPDPVLIADDFGDEALSIFDGAHSYAPMGDLHAALNKGETLRHWIDRAMPWWANHPRDKGKISTITVFPGYDDTKIRHPGMKLDRDGGRLYQTLWRAAADAGPDWVLITSFNEWHEGSEIEPSLELGDRYLTLTADGAGAFKALSLPRFGGRVRSMGYFPSEGAGPHRKKIFHNEHLSLLHGAREVAGKGDHRCLRRAVLVGGFVLLGPTNLDDLVAISLESRVF